MKGWRFAVKVSYFVISMVIIGAAYFYTDDLMAWVFEMMMQSIDGSLSQIGL